MILIVSKIAKSSNIVDNLLFFFIIVVIPFIFNMGSIFYDSLIYFFRSVCVYQITDGLSWRSILSIFLAAVFIYHLPFSFRIVFWIPPCRHGKRGWWKRICWSTWNSLNYQFIKTLNRKRSVVLMFPLVLVIIFLLLGRRGRSLPSFLFLLSLLSSIYSSLIFISLTCFVSTLICSINEDWAGWKHSFIIGIGYFNSDIVVSNFYGFPCFSAGCGWLEYFFC